MMAFLFLNIVWLTVFILSEEIGENEKKKDLVYTIQ